MNLQETTKLLTVIKQNYSNFELTKEKVQLWQELLSEDDANLMFIALKKYMLSSETGFAPQIATLRKIALSISNPSTTLTSGQAWAEVTSAISNFGWCREIEALNSMSDVTRKVVKAIGWQKICQSEELGVERGHFNRYFESMNERETQDKLIPESMKPLIKSFIKEVPKLTQSEKLEIEEPNKPNKDMPQFFKDALSNAFNMDNKSDDGTEEKRKKAMEELKRLEEGE